VLQQTCSRAPPTNRRAKGLGHARLDQEDPRHDVRGSTEMLKLIAMGLSVLLAAVLVQMSYVAVGMLVIAALIAALILHQRSRVNVKGIYEDVS